MTTGTLSGASLAGRGSGLERWRDSSGIAAEIWVAPAGSTAVLDVVTEQGDTDPGDTHRGDPARGGVDHGGADRGPVRYPDAVELRWSILSAQVPSTRAVVMLDGPGSGDPGSDFTSAHVLAEEVARFVGERSGVEAGPIEVLVFRPDTDGPGFPEPAGTAEGAEFRFRHRGGSHVRLTLSIPHEPGEA